MFASCCGKLFFRSLEGTHFCSLCRAKNFFVTSKRRMLVCSVEQKTVFCCLREAHLCVLRCVKTLFLFRRVEEAR